MRLKYAQEGKNIKHQGQPLFILNMYEPMISKTEIFQCDLVMLQFKR